MRAVHGLPDQVRAVQVLPAGLVAQEVPVQADLAHTLPFQVAAGQAFPAAEATVHVAGFPGLTMMSRSAGQLDAGLGVGDVSGARGALEGAGAEGPGERLGGCGRCRRHDRPR